MSDSFWNPGDQFLVWALNVVLQVGLVAALAMLIGLALRRSSAARYWLLCSALLVVMVCPVLTAVVQTSGLSLISVEMMGATPRIEEEVRPNEMSMARGIDESRQSQTSDASAVPPMVPTEINVAAFARQNNLVSDAVGDSISAAPVPSVSVPASMPTILPSPTKLGRILRIMGPPLVAIWAIVAAVLLMRLFIHWHRLSLLLRSAEPNTDEGFASTFQAACAALGIRPGRVPTLVLSNAVSGPIAAGIRSPTVVLPKDFVRQINSEQLRDILIHEVAHIVRGDQLIVLLQNIVGAVFWMHPLVRLLNRHLAKAREEVCDNYVLAATDAPSYSRTLLTLAQLLNSPRQIPGAVGLFNSRWKLEHRVAGLLDQRRNRTVQTSLAGKLLATAVAAMLISLIATGTMTLAGGLANSPEPIVAQVPQSPFGNETESSVTVSGVVLRPDGTPAVGAKVRTASFVPSGVQRLLGPDYRTPLSESITDRDGRFSVSVSKQPYGTAKDIQRFADQALKRTPIAAILDGFGPAWVTYQEIDSTKTLELRLVADQPIRGRLIDLEGSPVSNTAVHIGHITAAPEENLSAWITSATNGEPPWTTYDKAPRTLELMLADVPDRVRTATDGSFEIRGVGRERFVELTVYSDSVAWQQWTVVTRHMDPIQLFQSAISGDTQSAFGSEFAFTVAPSRRIEGVVIDANSREPLAGVSITSRSHASWPDSQAAKLLATTDQDGKFNLIGMPKGTQNQIMAVPNDDQPYLMRMIDVPDSVGLEPLVVTVELHRGIWIKGRVTDEVTGEPIRGARLHYLPLLTNEYAKALPEFDQNGNMHGHQMRYQTNDDGSYRIPGLPGRAIVGVETVLADYPSGAGYDAIDVPREKRNGWLETYKNPVNPSPVWPTAMREINPAEDVADVVADFKLAPGPTLEIRLVDEQGDPVTGASINGLGSKIYSTEPEKGSIVKAINFGPKESRTIVIHHKERNIGKVINVVPTEVTQGTFDVTLVPCISLTGRLVSNETPMSGLVITPDVLPSGDFSKSLSPTTTDVDGRFTCNLVLGCKYDLYAEGKGIEFVASIKKSFDTEPGKNIDLGTLTLTKDDKFVEVIVETGDHTSQP